MCLKFKYINLQIIDNSKGRINEQYPHKIPILQHERFPPRGLRLERTSSSSSIDDISPKGTSNRKRNSLGAPSPSNNSSPEPYVRSQSPRLNSPKKTSEITGTDIVSIDTLINEAKFARCRNRFVVPVILFQGKYICR